MAAYSLRACRLFTNKFLHSNLITNACVKSRLKSDDAKWNLFAALCIQRNPVISRDPTPLEVETKNMLQVIEYEKSLLSDHEITKANEKKSKSEQQQDLNFEAETTVLQTTDDLEDIWKADFEKFSPAPRILNEQNADRRLLKRYLERQLILVVKDKQVGDWRLPTCSYKDGETMRQTADRNLSEVLSNQLNIKVISNAPIGFYKFQYSRQINRNLIPNDAVGGKIFFFRAYYINGDLDLKNENSDVADYAWLNTEELRDLFVNRRQYFKSVRNFLMDESFTYRPSNIFKNKQKHKEGNVKMFSHSS